MVVTTLSIMAHNAECCYAGCHLCWMTLVLSLTKCHYADCRYADCRGAKSWGRLAGQKWHHQGASKQYLCATQPNEVAKVKELTHVSAKVFKDGWAFCTCSLSKSPLYLPCWLLFKHFCKNLFGFSINFCN